MIRIENVVRHCGHMERIWIICHPENYLYELDHAQYSKCRQCGGDKMSIKETVVIMAIGCILAVLLDVFLRV